MNREISASLRRRLLEELDMSRELEDGEILELIDRMILGEPGLQYSALQEKISLRQELFYSIRRLDVLQELIEDNSVTEIMVNGPDHIFIERQGRIQQWDKRFTSQEKLEDVIQQIVGRCNRVINESIPIVDARLENGARVHAVVEPVALDGPILTIRRFPDEPITMEKLISLGSVTRECVDFLAKLVQDSYSTLIGGPTSTNNTTFLNALSAYIPSDERVITIEDNAELQIQGVANLVRLETKTANTRGGAEVTIRDLIKAALRMRPDRLIVGEVRGAEAVDLLQALNTGHDGSLSTLHSNSSRDTGSRLETMALMGMDLPLEAVQRQIVSGVDVLVHLGRMRDKSRKVLEVAEVTGVEGGQICLQPLFDYREGEGLIQTGTLKDQERSERAGIIL